MKLVVADSSPLIALASSGHIDVLLAIIQEVYIPETVYQECIVNTAKPGAEQVLNAVQVGSIKRVPDPDISAFRDIDDLDIGEACAISLAITMKSAILIDDFIGRGVARANQLEVVGGCGILLVAKQRGLIAEVKPVIDAWKDVIGYRLSDSLVADVLKKAGEMPPPATRHEP